MNVKMIFLALSFTMLTLCASDSADCSVSFSMDLPQVIQNQVRTISEPVKIVKIELATNTVVVSNSEIDTFVVNPQYVDLKQFQVGTRVTATLKVTTTTDRLSLAKTSKTQLIKLQK
jgi:hypothetical protein